MNEMTASDMLKDPLIRQMLRADRISLASFAALLDSASRRQARRDPESAPARPAAPQAFDGEALSAL
ncbi:hypothetical protein FHX08_001135 [Rhizobium sp. BK529]|uniref:hypothetical protein n=1 Tax=unclassified Rhizobium TaxID=2613769 RepID=UPI0010442C8D|nr:MULTISPECIES: hypothetical protein [unclassified Rhizobium]MBB3590791.1 hypothetical protein [Rhizobium sp. BK529]TCS09255.1 hypothetical protein EV281_1011136 [Rhizobium sp. BK418]